MRVEPLRPSIPNRPPRLASVGLYRALRTSLILSHSHTNLPSIAHASIHIYQIAPATLGAAVNSYGPSADRA
jgi:hypothetical protein